MHRTTNITMGPRLALLGGDHRSALLFEPVRARGRERRKSGSQTSQTGQSNVSGKSMPLPPTAPAADVSVRELTLSNTLLASAVTAKKARFIRDCAVYMQNTRTPARDVFTHTTQPVSSVVVVPLLVNDAAFGALYFTQDAACDFSNIQDALLGFVHCATLTLHNRLVPRLDQLWEMVAQPDVHASASFSASLGDRRGSFPRSTSTPYIRGVETSESDDDTEPSSMNDIVPPLHSGRLSKVGSRRLCTEAMMQLLQQQITKGKRRSVELSFVADHLVINDQVIGQGGYGMVYRGTWHKRPAAIKVGLGEPGGSGYGSGVDIGCRLVWMNLCPSLSGNLAAPNPNPPTLNPPGHEHPRVRRRGRVRRDGDGRALDADAPQHRPSLLLPDRHGGGQPG
jgi:hypothetical protein